MGRKLFWLTMILAMLMATQLTAQPPGGRGRPDFGGFGGGRGGRGGRGGNFGGGTGDRIDPSKLTFDMGVAEIPDRETFEKLSYQGSEVMRDSYLADLEFVKFIIAGAPESDASIYWMNTENYRAHPPYMGMIGLNQRGGGVMRGALTWLPRLKAPDGSAGLYIFDFQPNDRFSFDEIRFARDKLVETMPVLKGKIAFHPLRGNEQLVEEEKAKYASSDVAVHLDESLFGDIAFLPLNAAVSFGRLRVMKNDSRPAPRDIVIYKSLPNEMPRVAGVITEARQTPLSHVNLRAIQDRIPNAFVANVLEEANVKSLLGQWVRYEVTAQGYKLRKATNEEVEDHFQSVRPTEGQTLASDLTERRIRPLTELGFDDSKSVGVKAANVAVMHDFDLPAGTVPDGFAVPFSFYDEFMKHNGFYEAIRAVSEQDDFSTSADVREKQLKAIRKRIRNGNVPTWMHMALSEVQKSFPEGQSIRCRSSTNNEDLVGFSGAGLYDSCTHRAEEGHLSQSIKQVFASLWNFRAYEEREFYRIDHMSAAMGVLLHANYQGEQLNGVAVTEDILYETEGSYYVNSQIGEDLVTNPDEESSPEELLLGWKKSYGDDLVRKSAHATDGDKLMKPVHQEELRSALARIYRRFANLYEVSDDDQFAMEIEFKITKDGKLAIKQARPWVF